MVKDFEQGWQIQNMEDFVNINLVDSWNHKTKKIKRFQKWTVKFMQLILRVSELVQMVRYQVWQGSASWTIKEKWSSTDFADQVNQWVDKPYTKDRRVIDYGSYSIWFSKCYFATTFKVAKYVNNTSMTTMICVSKCYFR